MVWLRISSYSLCDEVIYTGMESKISIQEVILSASLRKWGDDFMRECIKNESDFRFWKQILISKIVRFFRFKTTMCNIYLFDFNHRVFDLPVIKMMIVLIKMCRYPIDIFGCIFGSKLFFSDFCNPIFPCTFFTQNSLKTCYFVNCTANFHMLINLLLKNWLDFFLRSSNRVDYFLHFCHSLTIFWVVSMLSSICKKINNL